MKNHSIIFDEFYDNPYAIRRQALSYDFYYRDQLSFAQPDLQDDEQLNLMNNTNYCGSRTITTNKETELITNLKKILQLEEVTSFFHLHLESDEGDRDIHRDEGDTRWAGIIYLTPDPAPESGTMIFNDKRDEFPVENVFNRLLLWNPTLLHGVGRSFGNNKETGRLTQVFTVS